MEKGFKDTLQGLGRALPYLKPYFWREAAAIVISLIMTGLTLISPWVMKVLIDDAFPGRDMALLIKCFGVLAGSIVGMNVFSVLRRYVFELISAGIVADIRREAIGHMHRLPFSFFDTKKTGEIMSIFTNDIPVMGNLFSTSNINDVISDLLTVVVVTVVMMKINWKLACVSLVFHPLFVVAQNLFGRYVRKASERVQERQSEISEKLQETISGAREVRFCGQEDTEVRRLSAIFRAFVSDRLAQVRMGSWTGAVSSTIASLGNASVVFIGGILVIRGSLSIGLLIAFMQYSGRLIDPISRYSELNVNIQTALAAADRVFRFLDHRPVLDDGKRLKRLGVIKGKIEFHEVYFCYDLDRKEVLHNINLVVEPGEVVALVGRSGTGKSTLVHLIPRFYEPSQGSISIDGQDIRNINIRSLREQLGIVPQETFLFHVSIRDNIGFGKPGATENEIIQAAKIANAHDFIKMLPQGYDTIVGERGVKLSGGERQRLAIARALLKDPKILILDEATSDLDSESEIAVTEAIDKLLRRGTTFIIAHRLSTILRADRIVVLEKGRIIESGVHHELLKLRSVYWTLYNKQFRDIERTNRG